jgi:hypothetical protein
MQSTLEGDSTDPNTAGVTGTNSAGGVGVAGISDSGDGVRAFSTSGNGLSAFTTSGNNTAVFGENTGQGGVGVTGISESGDGVRAVSTSGNGLSAFTSSGGVAVFGSNTGTGAAVVGTCNPGSALTNDAVVGILPAEAFGSAIHGIGGTNAGLFDGHVQINGPLDVTGDLTCPSKHFLIDHPCDPLNKYLAHCSVESEEMVNIYSGNVRSNEIGVAMVVLPDYIEALNQDFRYQLTVIGTFAHAIVAEEIADNRFVIKTDKSHVKVSWQVTGIRRDAYAKAHPIIVEREKPASEKGRFLYPQASTMKE